MSKNLSVKNNSLLTSTPLFKNQTSGIGYPEVTLHPIQSGNSSHNQKNLNDNLTDSHANSLLHGILTKVNFHIQYNSIYLSTYNRIFYFRAITS